MPGSGPTVVAVHVEAPESWVLADLDARLAEMDLAAVQATFTLVGERYAQALATGTPVEMLDVFEAVVRDTTPR